MKLELKLANGTDVFSFTTQKNIDEETITSIVNVGLALLQLAAEQDAATAKLAPKQLNSGSNSQEPNYLSDDEAFYHAYKASNDKHRASTTTTTHYHGHGGYSYQQVDNTDYSEFEVFKGKTGQMKITILNSDIKYKTVEAISRALKIQENDARKYVYDNVELPVLSLEDGVSLLKEFKRAECYASHKIIPLPATTPETAISVN